MTAASVKAPQKIGPTSVKLDEPTLRKLDQIATREKRSRGAIIRFAIADYIRSNTGRIGSNRKAAV